MSTLFATAETYDRFYNKNAAHNLRMNLNMLYTVDRMWNSADADFRHSRPQTNMAGNSSAFRQFIPPNHSADQFQTAGMTWQEWYRRQLLPIPNGYSSQSSHLQNRYSSQSVPLQNEYSSQSSPLQNGYSSQSSPLQNGYSSLSLPLQNGYSSQSSHLQNGYSSQSLHLQNGYPSQSPHLQNGYSSQSSHLQSGYSSQSSHLQNGYSSQSLHLQNGCSSQSLPLQNGYSNQSSPLQNRYQNRSSSTPGRYQNPSSSTSDRYQGQNMPVPPRPKLFVGHLPDSFTSEELTELFERIGQVTEADVINKYGFVHFRRLEDAEMAINVLNNHNIKGSCISVEFSRSLLHATPGTPGRSRGGASGNSSQPNRSRIHGEVQQSGSQQPRTFQQPAMRGSAHMNHSQGIPAKESATLPSRFSSMMLSSNGGACYSQNNAVSQQHRNDRNYGGNSFYLSAPQSFTSGQPLIRIPAQTNNFRGVASLQGNFSGMVPSQNWDIYRDEAANVFMTDDYAGK